MPACAYVNVHGYPNEKALVEVDGLKGPWIERSPFTIAESYGLRPTASSLRGACMDERCVHCIEECHKCMNALHYHEMHERFS